MEYHNTMKVYAQEDPPFRHNLFGAADGSNGKASSARRENASPVLPVRTSSLGSVEMKVDDFVPKLYGQYAPASRVSPHSVSPVAKNKEPLPSAHPPQAHHEAPRNMPPSRPHSNSHGPNYMAHVRKTSVGSSGYQDEESSNHEFVGRRVRKFFAGHGWYYGRVLSRWESPEYGEQFHVKYDDDDSEDLTREVLLPLLLPLSPSSNEPAPVAKPTHLPPSKYLNGYRSASERPTSSPSISSKSPTEVSRRRKISSSEPYPAKHARVETPPHNLPPPRDSHMPNAPHHAMPSTHAPRIPSHERDPEVLDLTGSDDEHGSKMRRPSSLPSISHHTQQQPAPYPSDRRMAPSNTWRAPSPTHLPSFRQSLKPLHQTHPRIPNIVPSTTPPNRLPSMRGGASVPVESYVSSMGNDPLSAFNYKLFTAIRETSAIEPFGRSFVNVLTDEPRFHQCMDITRLEAYCRQRRYRALSTFMSDVVKIPTTVGHLYPNDATLNRQSESFTSVLAQQIRTIAPGLHALEQQLR
ncbi:hypothetical protein AeRB84_011469 [Aphanomyces euteiches]|nr:hypothetical protein AeRB84_011469 [Aphanomyces euteiches]